MSALRIEPTCLTNPHHAAAFIYLMNHYASDPFGGGKPLPESVLSELPGRLKDHPCFVSFIAFIVDEPVALINCFEGFSTFAARPLLNVHDIVVHRDHRKKRIGSALLSAAGQAARKRNCCKLTLEVLANNVDAISAYKQAGFSFYELTPTTGRALFMHKDL